MKRKSCSLKSVSTEESLIFLVMEDDIFWVTELVLSTVVWISTKVVGTILNGVGWGAIRYDAKGVRKINK